MLIWWKKYSSSICFSCQVPEIFGIKLRYYFHPKKLNSIYNIFLCSRQNTSKTSPKNFLTEIELDNLISGLITSIFSKGINFSNACQWSIWILQIFFKQLYPIENFEIKISQNSIIILLEKPTLQSCDTLRR